QNDLFLVGADLSNSNLNDVKNRVSLGMIEKLERHIDKFELELPVLTNFILPGGSPEAAQLHYVRTVVRRAETLVVQLSEKDEINSNCIRYLNRLSDLFFVMGRLINKRKRRDDVLWKI
ncbi:MAG: cob(I)yrinic acid a,c-diamide adenosyltransferase, partial [Nitrosopumilus sp.]|nr:cob(I)yrinic acid a,c-diamide adenosyltransferase [Nitrosopumilus sp.]